MQPQATCRGTRSDGTTCQSVIVLASGFCHMHDPDRAATMQQARRKGGKGKSRLARVERLVPATLRPVLTLLLDALNETHRGDLDPKVAGALAALAGAVVRVYSSATAEQQIQDLQRQIDALKSSDLTTTRRAS